MRLSEWRAVAPNRDAMAPKVLATVDPVLRALGCEPDPHAWVAWGDDPSIRYLILAPTSAGLVLCHVRTNVGGDGPRASAKVVRWNRIQLGELAIETQSGHRILSFQVEQQVLRGVDEGADRIAAFAIALMTAADGRPLPDLGEGERRRGAPVRRPRTGTSAARAGGRTGGSATASKPAKPAAAGGSVARGDAGAAGGRRRTGSRPPRA